ncbi:MAG: hypothetical protein A2138_04930 [Deltaproteobacteria bacterium RBG_16_71_12]|nr:MAG: hypothetical protein A2138_04930 [Deltaproteobacteria bacterium RBG_16_71_12]
MADTFHRLLRILQMIPPAPNWIDTEAIADRLAAQGIEPQKRTLQRDVLRLEGMGLGLENVDPTVRPYRWRYGPHAKPLFVPGVDPQAALALRLLELHLERLVPRSTMRALQPSMKAARAALEGNPVARWLDHVRLIPRSQPLLPPKVDGAVVGAVHEALLYGRQLKVRYKKPLADEPRDMTLHPLGLVHRDAVAYLVATAWTYIDPRPYPLHRMASAEMLDDKSKVPDGFDLDSWLASGEIAFKVGPEIEVALLFDAAAGQLLQESPLAPGQTATTRSDQRVLIMATVPDTVVLRSWILGFGPAVEVKKPAALRKAIAQAHQAAVARYR